MFYGVCRQVSRILNGGGEGCRQSRLNPSARRPFQLSIRPSRVWRRLVRINQSLSRLGGRPIDRREIERADGRLGRRKDPREAKKEVELNGRNEFALC
jgi:hypothetical protein